MVRLDKLLLAAAEIHDEAEIERHVGAVGEERDLLRRAVLEDFEVVARKIRHEPARGVAHGKSDSDKMNVGAEGRVLGHAARNRESGNAERKSGQPHTLILRGGRRAACV